MTKARILDWLPAMSRLVNPGCNGCEPDRTGLKAQEELESLLRVDRGVLFLPAAGEQPLENEFTLGGFDKATATALLGVFIGDDTGLRFYEQFGIAQEEYEAYPPGQLGYIVLRFQAAPRANPTAVSVMATKEDSWEYDILTLPLERRSAILAAAEPLLMVA